MVAAHSGAGVSALHNHHTWERGNGDDDGIILAMGGTATNGGNSRSAKKAGWSPRILFLQLSDDRPDSFNAMMNCTFASVKQNVVVDGCYFSKNENDHSPFLQQACDMTGGLYLTPKGPSQCGHFLTEILLSVFLSPRSCRNRLKLPAIDEVDFRARAFDTGNIVDQAFVCNLCLSIFEHKPTAGYCPTCGAEIKQSKKQKTTTNTNNTNN
jgi:transcription initiation factor TFIIH subunit 3